MNYSHIPTLINNRHMEILGKYIKTNSVSPLSPDDAPEPIQSFVDSIAHVFIDHSLGNIKLYQIPDGILFVYRHCEHNDARDVIFLAGLLEELKLACEVILWDGYWEKLMLLLNCKE